MKNVKFILIALLSTTLIALEIVWTRIFSAEFFYTFAFLVLSLAILGIGMGALSLRLFQSLRHEKYLPWFLSSTALFAITVPVLVFMLNLDFSILFSSWTMVGKFVLTIFMLSGAYFAGGISLAIIFKKHHTEMPKLYMADLLGAGAGVLLAMLLMNAIGTPLTTFFVSLPVLIAAFISSKDFLKVLPVGIAAGMVILSTEAQTLLQVDRKEPAPVVHTHWDAMGKIKMYERQEGYQVLNIDNVAHTSVIEFDGNWERPDSLKFDFPLNVSFLIQNFDSCRFLAIGAGGGADVMQALQAGATEIHAVEVMPYLNFQMLYGELAEYSGLIYHDPRVTVTTEDARSYVRRFTNKFDIIYSASSNTFASLASGAFALAENYLFTTEAFEDYWSALSDNGFMVLEHQVYMPRITSEVVDALKKFDMQNIENHFAVYDWPKAKRNVLLLSKNSINDEILQHGITNKKILEDSPFHLLYPAHDTLKQNTINQIVQSGWQSAQDSAIVDISPCTDNRPFIAQMGLWKNFNRDKLEKVIPYSDFYGFPLSKIIILIILLVVIVLIIPLNLLPYILKGPKLKVIPWLYFFAIGMAFMIVEIILIQKYTLFIGPSVYGIVTILVSLLMGSGIGSRFSGKFSIKAVFGGIITWLILEIFLFPGITKALTNLKLPVRMMTTGILIFPLGFFLGMPFPKGALKVRALIDWGFAVNGSAAVLGSTIIILVAFSYGFQVALALGILIYFLAFLFISIEEAW